MSEIDNSGMIFYSSVAATVLLGVHIVYTLVFKNAKKNGHYTLPSDNCSFKKIWAKRQLKQSKRNLEDYAADFNNFKSENISIAKNDVNFDSQMLYGSDDEGNSLLIKIKKGKSQNDEVWLILRLANGTVFTLPDRPQTSSSSHTTSDKFESSGLCIETLRHYKTLRVTFIGLLKEITSDENNTVTETKNLANELRFVKFNFLWASSTPPKHYPDDWNIDLRALALATEPWNGEDWMSFINTPAFGGYDQFGALLGQVFVENIMENSSGDEPTMEVFEMNLPGYRKRRCLPSNALKIHRNVEIIGVCFDGTIFEIGAISYVEKLTHAQYGYIRHANNDSYPIEWTDFHLAHIADDLKPISSKGMNIQFKANQTLHNASIYFVKNKNVSLPGNVSTVPVEIGLNGRRGFGVAIFHNGKSDPISVECAQLVPKLIHSISSPNNYKLAIPFYDTDASSLTLSGGKGASLALLNVVETLPANELNNLRFHVPAGFIVTVNSFNLQMRRNPDLAESIKKIRNVAYGKLPGNLEEKCQEAVEKLKNTILEKEVTAAISEHFETLIEGVTNSSNLKFAVRSSAIGEDGDDASSAGQNETFLGLRNLDEILESVKLCWASLFTYQSVEYRRQHVQPIDTQMSVVVQIMVHSDCAGVLFTRHPVSGDPSKILITANFGLGESVVSGKVDPDSYIVKRLSENELVIDRKQIGNKTHFLHMSFDDGKNIVEKNVTAADQSRCCLSDEQILKLSKIGVLLENLYGNARDIEWAIYQNEFYLLQSRPITTLNTLSNWELLHEFDSPIMSKDDLSTFAVVGELFPNTVSPLTISTIMAEMERRQEETMDFKSDFYNGRFTHSFIITQHRVALNVYKMLMSMTGKELTRADKITAITMFGHEYVTPEMHRVALQRNENAEKSFRKLLGSVVSGAWNNKKIVEANQKLMKTVYNRYSPEGVKDFQDAEVFNDEIEFELNDIDRYPAILNTHFNTSKVSTVYQMLALILLTEGSDDITVEHYADIALMLGSCKDVESAEVPKLLEEISIEIYNRGKANDFVNISPLECMKWLDENCSTAGDLVRAFLNKHGHRALKEYDLVAITWGMKPEQVIEMIQASVKGILSNQKDLTAKKKELSDQDIISQLKSPKKYSTKLMLSKIIPLCQKAVQRRETSKSAMIAFIHEIRKAYRHLAELLHAEGLLPNTELIFYLHREEILELLHVPIKDEPATVNKSKLITKAMRRMKLFPTWSSDRFNEMNFGVVKPINTEVMWNMDGNVKHVTGTPVCEGVVTSRACVIKSFEEVHKIQPGDILVTYGTDIGWSPYFPILGGIVTELGGLISHGAIVAREYGLPCVVGCTGATDIFKFGEKITMNGSKGIIIKADDGSDTVE